MTAPAAPTAPASNVAQLESAVAALATALPPEPVSPSTGVYTTEFWVAALPAGISVLSAILVSMFGKDWGVQAQVTDHLTQWAMVLAGLCSVGYSMSRAWVKHSHSKERVAYAAAITAVHQAAALAVVGVSPASITNHIAPNINPSFTSTPPRTPQPVGVAAT